MPRFQKGNTAGQATRWQPGQSGNPGGLPPIIRGVRLLVGGRLPPRATRGEPSAVEPRRHPLSSPGQTGGC